MNSGNKYILSALALILLAIPMASRAQEDKADDAGKKKAAKDKTSVVENEAEIGLYYLDDDAFRYGKYSGLTDDGAYALLDFRWEKRPAWNSGDAIRWRVQGWRLGLDSRRLEFDWHQLGKQRFNLDYRQIPNNLIGDGMTPYLGAGGTQLSLPSGWAVADGNSWTSGFLNLDGYLNPLEIKTERKSLALSYDLRVTPNWNMAVDYRHEIKDGTLNTRGVFGSGWTSARAAEIPAPVNWITDNLSLMFHYADGRFQGGGGVYASFFNNDDTALAWPNAFGKVRNWEPGVAWPDGSGSLGLPPDNSYLQLKAYGGINFNAANRLTADLSWGRMEQDEAFLPYTVNSTLLVPADLPRPDADAQIDTLYLALRYTSRLARNLRLVAGYVYDDRDNKTPQDAYRYVPADSENQVPPGEARLNLPYSYTRQKANLLLNWNVARGIGIKGGVEWNDYSRSYAEVEDSDEIGWLAGIRFASWQTVSASLDYRYSERDVDDYVGNRPYLESWLPGTLPDDAWQNHPWQRKYNQTDRDRDEWRLRVDWFPIDALSLGLTGSSWKDDYGDGSFGLNEAEAESWTVDFAWRPSPKTVVSGFYTNEDWQSSQSNRMIFSFNPSTADDPGNDWWTDSEDDVDTFNIHLGFDDLGADGHFALGFDYTQSKVDSRIDVTGAENVPTAPLPALLTEMNTFSAYGNLRLNDHSSLRLRIESNDLDASDFALDGVSQDSLLKVLTLGQSTQQYDVLLVSASWRYTF